MRVYSISMSKSCQRVRITGFCHINSVACCWQKQCQCLSQRQFQRDTLACQRLKDRRRGPTGAADALYNTLSYTHFWGGLAGSTSTGVGCGLRRRYICSSASCAAAGWRWCFKLSILLGGLVLALGGERVRGVPGRLILARQRERVCVLLGGLVLARQLQRVRAVRGGRVLLGWGELLLAVPGAVHLVRGGQRVRVLPRDPVRL